MSRTYQFTVRLKNNKIYDNLQTKVSLHFKFKVLTS